MKRLTVEVLRIGEPTFLESCPDRTDHAVVFEDNGETGYLYAVERNNDEQLKILDAVNIYDVARVIDKDIPSEVEIFWNEGLDKAAMVINGYCHAIIDFKNRKALCRTGFPPANQNWPNGRLTLTDEEVEKFFNE